ncbi:MAG: NADH-ubiquinone oxidoreductase-F iron-sulfur binding region domain-containing protein [Actinomycetes bacterium]
MSHAQTSSSGSPTRAADGTTADAPVHVTRLLAGVRRDRALNLTEHREVHGTLAFLNSRTTKASSQSTRNAIIAAGIGGRGGAGFPFAQKLAAVARQNRRPVVVVNVAESEPASAKDATLATLTPHLVLDGAEVAARLVGAKKVFVWTHRGHAHVSHALRKAVRERPSGGLTWQIVEGPDRYVAGESSAIVRHLSGGPAQPTTTPPRVAERGVGGAPTLLSNAETFAHVALVARHGAAWFRSVGTHDEPGTLLLTLAGAAATPGVVEVPFGALVGDVIEAHGGLAGPVDAVLVGGYGARWMRWSDAARLPVSRQSFRAAGADLGVGLVAFLPRSRCGLGETARLTRWMAGESAGQCGPCVNGLPAMAGAFEALVRSGNAQAPTLLRRWARQVVGRGACHHPDGVAHLVDSALDVFTADIDRHLLDGSCAGCSEPPVLPLPRVAGGWV